MQTVSKLSAEFKNAPRDASLVPCSASPALNREETLSVRNKVLADNLGEENLPVLPVSEKVLKTNKKLVYVLNKDGISLMPCSPIKARHLLKNKKAKVITCKPFTIQLLWDCEKNVQPVILGVDPGYDHIGFSAVTEKKELIAGKITLRKDVSKKITERRMYRRNRRSRLWHRKPRFNNRVASKKEEWLAPSIKHKLDSHIRLIEKIQKLLPVSKTIIEVASFDTQKMQNPEISGVKYQKGELQGYEIKEYLLEKWDRKCAYCGKANIPLEVEHINPTSRGGTNRVSNLAVSCEKCNQKKGNKTAEEFGFPEIQKKVKETLKAVAFMNNIRWKLIDHLGCQWTYGYSTKYIRAQLGLEKSHINDAFVIAGGSDQKRGSAHTMNQPRRNNRCLQLNRNGFKPSIRKQRYTFQPHSLVNYNNAIYEVKGVFNKGTYIRLKAEKDLNVRTEKVTIYQYMNGMAIHLRPIRDWTESSCQKR